MDWDPYPDLSRRCGVEAFKLPRRSDFLTLPPPADPVLPPHEVPYGNIPLHILISDYLCYDTSVSPSSSPSKPSSPILVHDSPSPSCTDLIPDELLSDCPLPGPSHVEREILPPCVLNQEDSITWTPDRSLSIYPAAFGVGDSDYRNWTYDSTFPETDEMGGLSERDTTDELIFLTKKSALAGEYRERLVYSSKELTFRGKDVIFDEKSGEGCDLPSNSGKDSCLPSSKKRKTAESEGGKSHSYFTRSKSSRDQKAITMMDFK